MSIAELTMISAFAALSVLVYIITKFATCASVFYTSFTVSDGVFT